MQRVFSLLVDNNPGVLSRVSGLFSKHEIQYRQYNCRSYGRSENLPELPLWPAEMS